MDHERLRGRIERTTPWLQHQPPRLPAAVSLPLAEVLADREHPTLIGGSPWSGRTALLEQIARRLLLAGRPPDRLGWVELGHPTWDDVGPADLVAALPGGALFLDDLPLEHAPWVAEYRGPTQIFAAVGAAAAETVVPPTSFATYLGWQGVELRASRSRTPDELVRAAFELSGRGAGLQEHLRRYLLLGGFPALLQRPPADPVADLRAAERDLCAEVLERTLYRRIPRDHAIREPRHLEALLVRLAATPGGLVSSAELGRTLQLTQPTVDKYLRVLEAVGLIVTLPNWAPGERARRGRRVFFGDGAVRNALLRRGASPLADPEEMGHLLVNALVVHAVNWARVNGGTAWHWRRSGHEVDLVLDHPSGSIALQVGSARHYPIRSLAALQEAHPALDARCWVLLHRAPPTWPAQGEGGIGRLPLLAFLLALG